MDIFDICVSAIWSFALFDDPVWPDVGTKSCQIFPKVALKSQQCFYLKSDVSQNSVLWHHNYSLTNTFLDKTQTTYDKDDNNNISSQKVFAIQQALALIAKDDTSGQEPLI